MRFWATRERAGARPHRHPLYETFERRGRHVLELRGDDINDRAEGVEGSAVVVVSDGLGSRDSCGRAAWLGREDVTAVTERRGGERQHPAELAAAEDADSGARRNHDEGVSATAAV